MMARAGRLGDVLARISLTGRGLSDAEAQAPLIDRAEAILGSDGEATLVARARRFLDAYLAADEGSRATFLGAAASRLGPDLEALGPALEAYNHAPSVANARKLHIAAEPRSQELIRRLNRASGGIRDLVRMREDLLKLVREDPDLASLDEDFRHLFASWFNRGFLELRRIDWHTAAAVLEKIILYEAVHEIRGWQDLRARVGAPDRQLYAFFHPALPDEPLIFVEVALTSEIPGGVGPILAEEREPLSPEKATTAVFYSISNCQRGLRGVSFGNFLIKTVVEELQQSFPSLETFVTLSPLPGLRRWAEAEAGVEGGDEPPAELDRLAARYLVEAKREQGDPVDPVARFHLGNGARLERINPGGDPSERGRAQSWGVMANYLYDLKNIERNHEAFAATGEVVAAPAVKRLARPGRKEARHG